MCETNKNEYHEICWRLSRRIVVKNFLPYCNFFSDISFLLPIFLRIHLFSCMYTKTRHTFFTYIHVCRKLSVHTFNSTTNARVCTTSVEKCILQTCLQMNDASCWLRSSYAKVCISTKVGFRVLTEFSIASADQEHNVYDTMSNLNRYATNLIYSRSFIVLSSLLLLLCKSYSVRLGINVATFGGKGRYFLALYLYFDRIPAV